MRATVPKTIKKEGDEWDGKKVILVKKENKKAQCKLADHTGENSVLRWFYCDEIQCNTKKKKKEMNDNLKEMSI